MTSDPTAAEGFRQIRAGNYTRVTRRAEPMTSDSEKIKRLEERVAVLEAMVMRLNQETKTFPLVGLPRPSGAR